MRLPEYVEKLIDQLNENGKECYVVGGAVRSFLLDQPIHDYDLTTNALPDEMKEIFSDFRTIDTGLKHGTLTVLSGRHPVEITTYRRDGDYQDHRHPDEVVFSSALRDDCARRDFTVNALCYHPKEGILDFYGGKEDLKRHLIRCIGDPRQRFDEDALRLLRAVRFAAQLDFEIEKNTEAALKEKKEDLRYVSMERIHEETDRILSSSNCANVMDLYREVFEVYLPEMKDMASEDYENTMICMERSVNASDLRMALLLRNSCFPDPFRILSRLKYSTASSRRILSLIQCESMPLKTKTDVRRMLNKSEGLFEDTVFYRKALDPSVNEEKLMSMYNDVQNDEYCFDLKHLAVNGRTAMALGYEGKDISDILNKVLEEVMHEHMTNDSAVLTAWMAEQKKAG